MNEEYKEKIMHYLEDKNYEHLVYPETRFDKFKTCWEMMGKYYENAQALLETWAALWTEKRYLGLFPVRFTNWENLVTQHLKSMPLILYLITSYASNSYDGFIIPPQEGEEGFNEDLRKHNDEIMETLKKANETTLDPAAVSMPQWIPREYVQAPQNPQTLREYVPTPQNPRTDLDGGGNKKRKKRAKKSKKPKRKSKKSKKSKRKSKKRSKRRRR